MGLEWAKAIIVFAFSVGKAMGYQILNTFSRFGLLYCLWHHISVAQVKCVRIELVSRPRTQ